MFAIIASTRSRAGRRGLGIGAAGVSRNISPVAADRFQEYSHDLFTAGPRVSVRFGQFDFDTRARRLTRRGDNVHLSLKAFDLLAMLVDARPAVVEKGAIRARLWPGVHVGDASLTNLVTEIRNAIDGDTEPSLIRTVHGVGYAFAAETEAHAPRTRDAACWLVFDDRSVPLAPGEHVLGRDAACDVWIDSSSVSRRHARVTVVSRDGAVSAAIEDLRSTNGTSVRGRRVTRVVPLADADRVVLGDVKLTFRSSSGATATTRRVKRR